ncbi:MAG: hypothetical protein D6698_12580 [Gammaproteobacteria bacterium]|nr:MAG: hypothetical protein D6698_12580 [Gammaproteobacteria bacterium]
MQNDRIIRLWVPAFCLVLLILYVLMNWGKLAVEEVGHDYLRESRPLQTLHVYDGEVEMAAYDLPTSDLMDRDGKHQLNFRYLTRNELELWKSVLSKSRFYINDRAQDNVKVLFSQDFISLEFEEHKLYLVAPPHAENFVRIWEMENSHRPDVFNCRGTPEFCQSIEIVALGGATEMREKVLIEDTVNQYFAPRGRWVSKELDIKLNSEKKQNIVLGFGMSVPFQKQSVRINSPQGSKYAIIKNGPKPKDDARFLAPFVFLAKIPLESGENIVRIEFLKTTPKDSTRGFFPELSGVLSQMDISPDRKDP